MPKSIKVKIERTPISITQYSVWIRKEAFIAQLKNAKLSSRNAMRVAASKVLGIR